LKLVADKKLKPMIETMEISEDNCAKAVKGVHDNTVRYRYTLTNYDKAFGKRE
jgi:alcohol dehydrogenase (NADP+)